MTLAPRIGLASEPGPTQAINSSQSCRVDPSRTLTDPATCGEDLVANAERVLVLAPSNCAGCADYHIRTTLHRCTSIAKGIAVDRRELITQIRRLLYEVSGAGNQLINILIAGSADTGILATCAHAAAVCGEDVLSRCRFVVVDRCPTPLILCLEFAERHKLQLDTRLADLVTDDAGPKADVIVLHSILRFVPPDQQLGVLSRLRERLTPRGRLVVSNRLKPDDGDEDGMELRKRSAANSIIEALIREGSIVVPSSPAQVIEVLERSLRDGEGRPGEFCSPTEFEALATAAGFKIISSEAGSWNIDIGGGESVKRHRLLAILGRLDR